MRRELATLLGLSAMVAIWGLNFAVVKWAIDAIEPLAFNALRHLLASAFMLVVLLASDGIGRPERSDYGRILFLGVVGVVAYQMAFILGLDRTRAGNASLMLALVPIFLLAMQGRDEPKAAADWVGASLSVLGVALVSGATLRMEGTETLIGDGILIVAAGVWAIYTTGAGPLIRRYGPLRTTAWTLWVGSAGLVLAGTPAMLAQDWSRVTAAAWVGVAYSALLAIGLAYLLWYRGVQRIGGAGTAVFSNLTPVIALLAGSIGLGETLTPITILGALLVIGGVVLVRPRPVRD